MPETNGTPRASAAADVAPPEMERLVALPRLRLNDGSPAIVRCEKISPLAYARIMGQLPQVAPTQAAQGEDSVLRFMASSGAPLIEAGTTVLDAAGNIVRPGVSFSGHPGSIPGDSLTIDDCSELLLAIVSLAQGGRREVAAVDASFPHIGSGRPDGDRAVGADALPAVGA